MTIMTETTEEMEAPVSDVTTGQVLALFAWGYDGPEPEDKEAARRLLIRLRTGRAV